MHIIRVKDLAEEMPERLLRQYPTSFERITFPRKGERTAAAMLEMAQELQVTYGSQVLSWLELPTCSECGKRPKDWVVEVGEKMDYDSATAWLCHDCVRNAYLLSSKEPT